MITWRRSSGTNTRRNTNSTERFLTVFKDSEKKRQYRRDYMRRRRAKGLTGESTGELNPETETAKFNLNRPHRHCSIKIAGIWRRVAEQDGRIYDRGTGELLSAQGGGTSPSGKHSGR